MKNLIMRSLLCPKCGRRFLSMAGEQICRTCAAKKTAKAAAPEPKPPEPAADVPAAKVPGKAKPGISQAVPESVKAVCPQCGTEFTRSKQQNKVYCSRACKENARKHRNWQVQNNHTVKEAPVIELQKKEITKPRLEVTVNCEFCGAEFHPFNSRQRFCCRRCQGKASNLRRDRICAGCGKVFHTASDRTKYCQDCQLKFFGLVRGTP